MIDKYCILCCVCVFSVTNNIVDIMHDIVLRYWDKFWLIVILQEQHTTTTATASSSISATDNSGCGSRLKINDDFKEDALKKRDYVMHELVETEKEYVKHLSMVVDGYMSAMRDPENSHCDIPVPEDLRSGKEKMIFGNIEPIYEWHRE